MMSARKQWHQALAVIAIILSAAQSLHAQGGSYPTYPQWWTNQGLITTGSINDYAIANIGEAKNFTVAAIYELDTDLAQFGGAGPTLDTLAATLITTSTNPTSQTNDYAIVNIGQLKNLTQPIYNRLMAIGYYAQPVGSGTTTSGTYPWLATGHGTTNDYATANIGQLKHLFSFDPDYSATGDSIPDWWKNLYGLGPSVTSTNYVPWSNGQATYFQAYIESADPVDYYNGNNPIITAASGTPQTGSTNGFAPAPLVAQVTDQSGNPLAGAPVAFAISSGTGGFKTSYMATPVSTVTALTNASGQASVFFQLPSTSNTTTTVTAAPGSGSGYSAQATFTLMTDGGTGTYSSPFAPSNGQVVFNSDGSLDFTWQNNSDDPSDIPIYLTEPDGSLKLQTTVPAGTTHVHIANPQ
jgi:hypothetical protein